MPERPGQSTGYAWHHMVKMVPEDGLTEVLDLMQELPDVRGPNRTVVSWTHEQDTRSDINKIRRQKHFGFRARVTIIMDILNINHHRVLVRIMNAFGDDTTDVFLSLDGGFLYRKVIMTKPASPRPIRNLIVVGATFELTMETAELIDEMVPIADAW